MSELYQLPDGWEWKKLSEVFIVKDGTHDSPKYILNNGFPLFTSKNLKENGLDKDNYKLISEEDYNRINQRSKVDKGDLLFAMIGTIGNPTIIEYEPNFAIKNVALFKPMDKNNLIELLEYYFLSKKVIDKMISEAKGATQKFVGLTYLRNFPFPSIPLPEQQRIVSKLDALFEKIDKAIALHVKNMEEADAFMGSVLNDVFGELEKKYEFYKIYDKFDLKTGGTPSTKNKEFWDNGTIKWLSSSDINQIQIYDCKGRITELGFNSSNTKIIAKDSVLIALNGQGKTRGSVAMLRTEATLNQSLVAMIPKKRDENMSDFLFRNLQMRYIEIREMTGLNERRGLNMKLIGNIELPLPPLPIQQKTVTYLDEISQKMEKIKQLQKEKLSSLKALKASILDQTFRGKL